MFEIYVLKRNAEIPYFNVVIITTIAGVQRYFLCFTGIKNESLRHADEPPIYMKKRNIKPNQILFSL